MQRSLVFFKDYFLFKLFFSPKYYLGCLKMTFGEKNVVLGTIVTIPIKLEGDPLIHLTCNKVLM